jgi:predicted AAA+ superfamily ATPase
MEYIKRHLEQTVLAYAKMFPAVLVTGARQVGKTTMLENLLADKAAFVSLDNRQNRAIAQEQQELFFRRFEPPVIVDEVQYAPNLFSEIKQLSDREKGRGQFFMTGSQAFRLMKNVSETLAGRVGIIHMQGLSLREMNGCDFREPFIPTEDFLKKSGNFSREDKYWAVWEAIVRGGMPAVQDNLVTADAYYSSYLATYLERDVRDLSQIGDEMTFLKFMTAAAAQTANLLNYQNMANSLGVSPNTVKHWTSILVASGIVCLLEPYGGNIVKRAVKTPKLYFMDTGLACHLARWRTAEQAASGAMAGALFENFVVSEIMKSYCNVGRRPPVYFYRDRDGNEIDLLIEENGTLYPIEIKLAAHVELKAIRHFSRLDDLSAVKRGTGCVVSMSEQWQYLDGQNFIVPVGLV